MRLVSMVAVLFAVAGVSHAGDLNVHLMLSGEVAPGVYGQVQIGNDRPPPLVYAQPMLIEPQFAPPPPVYLHVPPGHAKNWRKHCREYNACNRPVYFIRSAEYEPAYAHRHREHERERERYQEHADHERGHDHDHEHGHDRDDDHGHGHGHDEH